MWHQGGAGRATEERPCPLSTVPNPCGNLPNSTVDKAARRRLYSPTTARRSLLGRDGAPAKHLTDSGDQTSDFGRVFWASAALRYSGEGDRTASGLFDK